MKSDVIAFLDRWFTRQKLRNPLRGSMRREVDKGVDFTMIKPGRGCFWHQAMRYLSREEEVVTMKIVKVAKTSKGMCKCKSSC